MSSNILLDKYECLFKLVESVQLLKINGSWGLGLSSRDTRKCSSFSNPKWNKWVDQGHGTGQVQCRTNLQNKAMKLSQGGESDVKKIDTNLSLTFILQDMVFDFAMR